MTKSQIPIPNPNVGSNFGFGVWDLGFRIFNSLLAWT